MISSQMPPAQIPFQVLVRSDNVTVPDSLRGTQVLRLTEPTTAALREAIAERYGFPAQIVATFELWSNPMGRSRTNLDEIRDLTKLGHDTVYFRARLASSPHVVPRARQDTSYGDTTE